MLDAIDLKQHSEIVATIAQLSPIFSNGQVQRAGRTLILRNLSRGETVIPADVELWALRLWNLSMDEDAITVMRSLSTLGVRVDQEKRYLRMRFTEWTKEAKRLWAENDAQRQL